MVTHSIIIVHPWDLARTDSRWDLLGRGHIDDVYERHIRWLRDQVLHFPAGHIGIYLGLREFRIHPSLEGLQEFVLYDDSDWVTELRDYGIRYVDVGGYAFDICVVSFVKRTRHNFVVTVHDDYCLPTIGGKI